MTLLTKSKYMIGLQCPQYLWVVFNAKDELPETSPADQFKFDQGHEVGNLAKKWFPEGIDLSQADFKTNLDKTKESLTKHKPLFEAGFMKDSLFSRIDILQPDKDGWNIIEVKSSTSVKEEHYHDVAFQKHTCEKAGIKIRKCFLMHINNEFIKQGQIDPKELLIREDITEEVEEASKGIKERIERMFDIIKSDKPETLIGKECDSPYECPLKENCWKFLPKESVFDLYNARGKQWQLFAEGIQKMEEIPDNFKLNEKQDLQKECAIKNKIHVHKEKIKHFLKTLHYPLYYLDFETFSFAIPIYDGTKPYQQIPFQFSLHIQQKDGKITHHEFLAEGSEDPRPKFAEALRQVIGEKGSIIVYNQSFEIGRLREIAEAFPEHKDWIENALIRIVDLILPFRDFAYYNPKQKGSCSIKYVLPAMTGKGYQDLEISNGGDASLSFVNITFNNAPNREEIRKNLLIYCNLDTEGMIWIVDELINQTK